MTSIIRWALSSSKNETVSGAIDVIVVEQANGELQSSPFHVRFGKLELLKGEIVHIRVNGVEVPLKMRLGSAGEAFFVERASARRRQARLEKRSNESSDAAAENVVNSSPPPPPPPATQEKQKEEESAAAAAADEAPTPPPAVEEEAAEEDKKKVLTAVLPKWYTDRVSEEGEESNNDQEALLAALEWREQQQARKLEERAASEIASSTKTDDEEDECSIGAVDFDDQKDEESPQLSWIWNFGSLPKKLLAPLVLRGRKDDDEIVKDLLEELVSRVVAENEEEDDNVRSRTNSFGGFRSLLWNRKSRHAANSSPPIDTLREEEKNATSSPNAADEHASNVASPTIIEQDDGEVVILDQAPAVPCELVIKTDDGREEIVSEAKFRSDPQIVLANPRLRVRLFGIEKTLSDALPELIARAVFPGKGGEEGTLAVAEVSADEDDRERQNIKTEDVAAASLENDSCPNLAVKPSENLVAAVAAAAAAAGGAGEKNGETQQRSPQEQVKDILNSTTPEQQNLLAAEIVAAAAEEHERGFELGSSDNLAALVALDQINPELSSGSLAALIHNNSDTIKAAFEDMRRRHSSSDSLGFPIDGGGTSSASLSSTHDVEEQEEEVGAPLEEDEEDDDDEEKEESSPVVEGLDVLDGDDEPPSIDEKDYTAEKASAETRKRKGYPYRKTLRPSARQIASLSLKRGANTVEFFVHTPKGGEQVVSSTVYLWSRYARCVFAEIDGVIASGGVRMLSRSRLGGKQTSQNEGAAELFTNIARNGYNIVYVTTRASGIASGSNTTTREALEQLWTQEFGDLGLPRAPVLLAPGSLLDSAYHSETRFKAAALSNVLKLFPGRNPLWAALARHQDDIKPYLDAGVPRFRVFRVFAEHDDAKKANQARLNGGIDQSGALVSSYARLNSLIHQIFPAFFQDNNNAPSRGSSESTTTRPPRDAQDDRYNDLNFWKLPAAAAATAAVPTSPLSPRVSSSTSDGKANREKRKSSADSRSRSPKNNDDSSLAASRQSPSPSSPTTTNKRTQSLHLNATTTSPRASRDSSENEPIAETTTTEMAAAPGIGNDSS